MDAAPKPETQHMETEALLAVMHDDEQRLFEILNDMSVPEILEFYQQVTLLGTILLKRLPRRNAYQPRHQRD